MKKLVSLKELNVELIGGQIMSRVTVKDNLDDSVTEVRKVIIPKVINSDGTITIEDLPEEKLRVAADEKRITKIGDIVIKLSTPYDAAVIDEQSSGCLVPSFCAIIRHGAEIDTNYMLAYLNSSFCKEQLKQQVAGSNMAVLSVGKVASVLMPLPLKNEQIEIGNNYIKTQDRLKLIKQIVALETKRNDVFFKELVKDYE